jgi:hypothetical protein
MPIYGEKADGSPGCVLADVIEPQLRQGRKRKIWVVHDECCFFSHDGGSKAWVEKGKNPLKKKGEGKPLMVSEFLCECHGHMRVTAQDAPNILEDNRIARVVIQPGTHDDGYWRNNHLVDQLRNSAIPVFNALHPGCEAIFAFDNSSNHRSYAPDALLAKNLNVKDGGKAWTDGRRQIMRDGWWMDEHGERHIQSMSINGTQRGLKSVLEERGLYQQGMQKPQMQEVLSEQPDFAQQLPWLEETVKDVSFNRPHHIIYFPKFHCELNWIERYWGHAKKKLRRETDYKFETLKANLGTVLDSVPLETMRKYSRKCWRYMDAYRGTNNTTLSIEQVEWATKKYSSHRRIPDIDFVPQRHAAATLADAPQMRNPPGAEEHRPDGGNRLEVSDSDQSDIEARR